MTAEGLPPIAGVIGWPVGHSLSPRLHRYWLSHYRIAGHYLPFPVPREAVSGALEGLRALGLAGVNVTVPHKESVIPHLDRVEPAAERIGAVNTIVVDDDRRLLGRNTDVFGFMAALAQAQPDFDATAGPAVVLGAGGAARGVVAALVDAGCPAIRLVNRTRAKAERLAADLRGPVEPVAWEQRDAAMEGAALLVNATSLGMKGQPPLEFRLDALPPEAVVDDIVYVPLETELLAAARKRGNPTADGLGMLLHQARPAFEAFFGRDPEVTDALRRHVLAEG
jgi:shikimate dehydrogenase